MHVINNYYKAGTASRRVEIMLHDSANAGSSYYFSGNLADDPRFSSSLFPPRLINPSNFSIADAPVFTQSDVTVTSAQEAYDQVTARAGAITPVRDSVDARVIGHIQSRTGSIIDSQNDVGGWPSYRDGAAPPDTDHDGIPDGWENAHGLDPTNKDDGNGMSGSGYTWVEEYVNSLIPAAIGAPRNLRVLQ